MLNLPTPRNLLRMQRVFMLARLIRDKQHTLLYLLHLSKDNKQSWIASVIDDMQALWPIIIDQADIWDDPVIPPVDTLMSHFDIGFAQKLWSLMGFPAKLRRDQGPRSITVTNRHQ